MQPSAAAVAHLVFGHFHCIDVKQLSLWRSFLQNWDLLRDICNPLMNFMLPSYHCHVDASGGIVIARANGSLHSAAGMQLT